MHPPDASWLSTDAMASCLGVSVRTLHNWRQVEGLFEEGRHYRRKSLLARSNSPLVWHRELVQKAVAAEYAKGGEA